MKKTPTRVLLIEDDEEDYILTRDLLQAIPRWPVELDWVDSLADGLEWLAGSDVGVVLLDLSLPDAQGIETVNRVHAQTPDVPVIVLTGMEDEDVGVAMLEAGVQDYLVKGSVTGDQLVRSMRYAIERKKFQRQLQRAREELEERVVERTAQLADVNEDLRREVAERENAEKDLRAAFSRLQDHDRAKSQFVSNVSHELKTPLTSMGYAADNLLAGVFGPLPERVRKYVSMIRSDCDRLTRTVSDILDVSRLEASRLQLTKSRVAFGRFVQGVVDAFSVQCEAGRRTLVADIDSHAGFVECDTEKCSRVVANILQNALKYTAEGGRIEVTAGRDADSEGMLVLDVIDDGIGIPKEFLGRVTERYFRVGEHVTGTGLGLSLAKDIVELHGGELVLESPPPRRSKGTLVRVRIKSAARPLVLVVREDPAVAQLAARQIGASGYRTLVSGRGDKLRTIVREKRPDVTIFDLCGAGDARLQALAAAASCYDDQSCTGHCIGIISGQIDRTTQEMIDGLGLLVIQEPWKVEELLSTVEQAALNGQ